MDNKVRVSKGFIVWIIAFFIIIGIFSHNNKSGIIDKIFTDNTFKLISSSENIVLDKDIKEFARKNRY